MNQKKPIEDQPYEWFLLEEYGIDWKDSKKIDELLSKYKGSDNKTTIVEFELLITKSDSNIIYYLTI